MQRTSSPDGTDLAFEVEGHGPVVVIVGGAMSTAADAAAIGTAIAEAGFTAVRYDRRARGSSGDTAPFAVAREVDDLAAVIDATGGAAAVLGHSSGALLALLAAASDAPITRLFLSEPPFRFGDDEPAEDLAERLQASVDAGRGGEAITMFQREAVGLPDQMIDGIRRSPGFEALTALAQSVVYDTLLARAVSTPTPEMLAVAQPVTIMCGTRTFPVLQTAARRLAAAMPHADLVELVASLGHRLDPAEAATVIRSTLSDAGPAA